MIDDETDSLLCELDSIAANFDIIGYGLPTKGAAAEKLAAPIHAYRDAAIAKATRWIPETKEATNDSTH